LTARPATNTESTFDVSAKTTIVPIGSTIGAVLIAWTFNSTMSACLPGVSDPTLSSSAQARAPSIVANSSTSRCDSVGANASSGVSVCAPIRSYTRAVRICVNISPGTLETTSTLSDGRTPRSRSLPVGGGPWPISIST
jgi:hypothetical protein